MDAAARAALNAAMGRLARGDRAAFSPVFETVAPVVRRLCRQQLTNEADADDAAQAALIKLFERAPDFDPDRDALGWALSIAWWECRSVRTARRRHLERCDDRAAPDALAADHDAEQLLIDSEADAILTAALGDLSPADRDALAHALTHDGALTPAARKRKQRALSRLRSLLLRTAD